MPPARMTQSQRSTHPLPMCQPQQLLHSCRQSSTSSGCRPAEHHRAHAVHMSHMPAQCMA